MNEFMLGETILSGLLNVKKQMKRKFQTHINKTSHHQYARAERRKDLFVFAYRFISSFSTFHEKQ